MEVTAWEEQVAALEVSAKGELTEAPLLGELMVTVEVVVLVVLDTTSMATSDTQEAPALPQDLT